MLNYNRSLTALLLLMIGGLSARAEVIHVPLDYPTIQDGIENAVGGDIILVADGTYSGPGNFDVSFQGKAVNVVSLNGPLNCVIDCMEQGSGFIFEFGEDAGSILSGFTIINGRACT